MKNKNQIHQKEPKGKSITANTVKKEVVLEEEESEQSHEKGIFIEASKHLNKGLKFTGGILSKGFEGMGSFIAHKVPKNTE